jgi:hypothetical protein
MTLAYYEPTHQLAQQLAHQQPPAQREELQAVASPTHRKLATKFLTNDLSWLSRQQDVVVPSPHPSQPTSGAQPWYQVALV